MPKKLKLMFPSTNVAIFFEEYDKLYGTDINLYEDLCSLAQVNFFSF